MGMSLRVFSSQPSANSIVWVRDGLTSANRLAPSPIGSSDRLEIDEIWAWGKEWANTVRQRSVCQQLILKIALLV